MSVFKNLPWRPQKTQRPDKFGGHDWFVVDATGAIVAECFQIVGENAAGILDERDAEALATMTADMANKTADLA